MSTPFNQGDRVSWNTPQGRTQGRVVRRLTEPIDIEGTHIAASSDDPRFLVESEKTGKQAAHKAEALRKLKG